MSKSSNGVVPKLDLPVLVDPRLVKALAHVTRQHILLIAAQGPVSPRELSELTGEGLSQVSYHVRVLFKECDKMIELIGTEPRRGAVEHYYRTSAKTLLPAKAWRKLRKGLRAVVGGGQASDLFNDLAAALKAGKLKEPHDHISRTLLTLDAEGQRNMKAIAQRATAEVEDEQRATAQRMDKANGNGGKVALHTFALLAFETAGEATDLHALVSRAEAAEADATANGAGHSGNGRAALGNHNGRKRRAKAIAR
jgi:DNA-binding transcriptional ArsR family regulator